MNTTSPTISSFRKTLTPKITNKNENTCSKLFSSPHILDIIMNTNNKKGGMRKQSATRKLARFSKTKTKTGKTKTGKTKKQKGN